MTGECECVRFAVVSVYLKWNQRKMDKRYEMKRTIGCG